MFVVRTMMVFVELAGTLVLTTKLIFWHFLKLEFQGSGQMLFATDYSLIRKSELKLLVFLSKNVSDQLAERLNVECEFEDTSDLGSYLGMPVLHCKVSKTTFQPLIDKISAKLTGWKGKTLSFAGRITLAKSVLSSIPLYNMATVNLLTKSLAPSSGENEMGIKSFIWLLGLISARAGAKAALG
ncbi:hypothetical protein V2J09_001097 [Rumex salicifolius]